MKIFVAVLLVSAVVFSPNVVLAKQWSPAEEEVWQVVENWHDVLLKEGYRAGERFWHKEITFWPMGFLGAPMSGESVAEWMRFWEGRENWVHYQLARMGMGVVDNVAVCQYYLTVVYDTPKEETKVSRVRAQVTLIKKGDKWLVLGIAANPYEVE